MTNEIKPSGTDWETADELREWEGRMIGAIQRIIADDFGDGDSPTATVSKEEMEGKTLRATYMGARRFGDHLRCIPEGYLKEFEGVQVTEWRLRYPDLQPTSKALKLPPRKRQSRRETP
jgi:hypothetical protein